MRDAGCFAKSRDEECPPSGAVFRLRPPAEVMARAWEMLKGEKNRLSSPSLSARYRSKAKALFPRTSLARSVASVVGAERSLPESTSSPAVEVGRTGVVNFGRSRRRHRRWNGLRGSPAAAGKSHINRSKVATSDQIRTLPLVSPERFHSPDRIAGIDANR